ncbi:flavodoxin family protein [Methanolobus mangrovi]|uniref:Flavodoxin family protein n=1 Tax=Methanolobus mangrovi TaxID=3072977 RepID=A0AA51YFS1_9EURY|nr:flavodoxin family protein [Methanolobus mangrovi]WMW21167.1 flavodoxin family protein [Methanolobus mangrovi]
MKTLVTYMTQTGNTQKIAEAIYGELEGEKEIKPIGEVTDLEGYDLAFIGFPVLQFDVPPKVKSFLSEKTSGKNVAIFMTHAVPEGFEAIHSWTGSASQAAEGANILGTFDCQGELAQPVIDMLLKADDPQMKAFGEMGPSTKGQPDASRVQKAKEFAKEIQAKL